MIAHAPPGERKSPAPLEDVDRADFNSLATSALTDTPPEAFVQEPSSEAIEAADEFVLDELFRVFDMIESYAVSGKEAARRGDRDEVRLRLRVQLRDCFRHAVDVHNLLSPGQPNGGGA